MEMMVGKDPWLNNPFSSLVLKEKKLSSHCFVYLVSQTNKSSKTTNDALPNHGVKPT
jgi:hypothetical protein